MRRIFLIFLISILSLSFLISDAQAKRFGGGRSFGMSRSASNFSRPVNPARSAAAPSSPVSGASKWLGPLAGLAMGGLLASLFMGHGLGSGILSWLMIGGVILLLWRLLQNRARPVTSPFQAVPTSQNFAAHSFSPRATEKLVFDEVEFLRTVKASFLRLQAAYDAKNLADIREFTSPEVFAEIQLQLQERGAVSNHTEVVSVEAQLVDLTEEFQTTIASVEFKAEIREEANAPVIQVQEIWHFRKNDSKPSWVVAGIQQNNA